MDVDSYLKNLPDWQRHHLEKFRQIIKATVPDITEDIKWGVPVFLLNGRTLFAMSAFKNHTKYNFILNGALLDDPTRLFNNGLESKKSRGIDRVEHDRVDGAALGNLVAEAAALSNK